MTNHDLGKTATQITIDPHGFDCLADYVSSLSDSYHSAVVFSDETVFPFYGEKVKEQLESLKIRVEEVVFAPGESTKSIESVYYCWESLAKKRIDRKSLVVTLGGGVVSDLGGFVASTFMRGIDVIHLPTTLLGMVDAAIGGKTGINLPYGKNLIGTFHHPKLVLIDTRCLESLPEREYKAGISELIKYGVVADAQLFDYLDLHMKDIVNREPGKLETVISRACEIKSAIVMKDVQDQSSVRAILNYGHTFAHALEQVGQFKKLLHGEAVSIGMSCAAYLSHLLGFVSSDFVLRQDRLCSKAGLPITYSGEICRDQLLDAMKKDKKAVAGKLSFILTQGLGKAAKVDGVSQAMVAEVLQKKATESKNE